MMDFERMNAIQRRLHNAACVLGADGDEYGFEQLQRDAITEIEHLRDAVRSARADEAHCWAARVDALTAQLREVEARYMALLKSVADGVAMQPRTVVLNLGPNAPHEGTGGFSPGPLDAVVGRQTNGGNDGNLG